MQRNGGVMRTTHRQTRAGTPEENSRQMSRPVPSNPFDHGYYESEELREFGFAKVGENVKIARNCLIVGLANISIGSHVRIDDYVQIVAATGHVTIGSYIHIGGGSYLSAAGGITFSDFSAISQGVRIYSITDDYSGGHLTNPLVPRKYLGLKIAPVVLGRHAIVGSGSVILPGCDIGEGASVGALSLVTRSVPPWSVCLGIPAKRLWARSKDLLELERQFLAERAAEAGGAQAG
jgi:galactoside O-acetyltransferase